MPPQLLFGGSMSIALPAYANDVSTMRDVPDNQEVFVHNTTDQSIIIEILQFVDEEDDDALRIHFEALASDNDALANVDEDHVTQVSRLSQIALTQCSKAYLLTGRQRVAKYAESAHNDIDIHMALFRLPQFTTDIVITFNNPTTIHPGSSSYETTTVSSGDQTWTLEQFRETVESLSLLNPGLFG